MPNEGAPVWTTRMNSNTSFTSQRSRQQLQLSNHTINNHTTSHTTHCLTVPQLLRSLPSHFVHIERRLFPSHLSSSLLLIHPDCSPSVVASSPPILFSLFVFVSLLPRTFLSSHSASILRFSRFPLSYSSVQSSCVTAKEETIDTTPNGRRCEHNSVGRRLFSVGFSLLPMLLSH